MKKIFYILVAASILCGCSGHSHKSADAHEEHAHIHNYTAYTHKAELFMQHEGLELGKQACITLYATDLSNFKPLQVAEATVLLRVGGKSYTATTAAHNKGMFHFELTPEAAGDGVLYVTVGEENAHFDVCVMEHCNAHDHEHNHDAHSHSHSHSGDAHNHDAHNHSGHSHAHSHAPHPGHGVETPAKSGDVTLTKEQSWKIDFATEVASESNFAGTVKVAAKVEAHPSDFTTIVATTSGKVQFAANVLAGMQVSAEQPLFYLEGGDVTDNDAAVKFAEAESNYELAKADFERKKSLFIDKIVSEREYQTAEAAYRQAEARFASMKRNFGAGRVTLKSSMNGNVASLLVANGDYVEPGTPLAIVQRDGGVNLVAELPVRYAPLLQNVATVNVETAQGAVYDVKEFGGTTVVGNVANKCNMLPVSVSCAALPGVVTGGIVTLYISSVSESEHCVAVPRTALVEEMGNMFVFVQNNPISFEKRSVKVGATDGRYVQLLEGVAPGERIVSKGGVMLKLSQGAAALDPHAGHVH
ncbi:MAG: efflux RND transporter periplasmic adaptor subunit [Bacteroidaceae bacterium]|nr:efflux RND transporter periplasmic adaptor subunit [Bacteroidaceae bacterium]